MAFRAAIGKRQGRARSMDCLTPYRENSGQWGPIRGILDMTLNAHDKSTWLETIWDALHIAREDSIPESDSCYDAQWDDICTAMAWITESLELEIDSDGNYQDIDQSKESR